MMRLGVAVAVLALLVTGCPSPREPQPAPPTPSGEAPAGTIRLGYPGAPPTLDPAAAAGFSAATRDLLRPVYPALFRLTDDLRPVPELAASFPSEADIDFDPFTVTVRLRSDATWSDGTPITSADVRYSWERLREGPTGARYSVLRDVEVGEDPRGLRLHFDRPVRRWWALFSIDDMILPAHASADPSGAPTVSGGPYAFDGMIPGLSLRLRRNESWWGGSVGAEAIEVLFVPDDEMRLELLERGELDAVYAVGESNWGRRAAARGFPRSDGPLTDGGASGAWASAWWELAANLDRLGGRRDLLEAVRSALHRDLAAEILEDSGQVMNGIPDAFPAPPPRREGLPALPGAWPASVDIARARAALERAGYTRRGETLYDGADPVELVLATPAGSSAANALARWIHFSLRDLGIRTELVGVETDRFDSEWVVEGKADLYLHVRRAADAPDPTVYGSDARPAGRTEGIDDLVGTARSAGSRARLDREPVVGLASGAWRSVTEHLVDEGSVTPLVRVRAWIVARPGISGPHPVGTAAGPLWNAADWRMSPNG